MKKFFFSLIFIFCAACQNSPDTKISTSSTVSSPTVVASSQNKNSEDTINIPFEKFTLPNGLDVIFHTDKRLPVVHVNLWYHVGAKDDPKNILGFAHLFEHMMFQGTKHAPREFLEYFNELSATGTNATTSQDRTNYYNTVPTENLETLLWLEADRMGFMVDQLDEKQFANQKDVVSNESKERKNSPYAELSEAGTQLYPEGHPYKHLPIGDMALLAKASLQDVKDFYSKYYTPNNASLVIAGNFDAAKAKAWVEKYFGGLKPGPAIIRTEQWIPKLDNTHTVRIEKNVPFEVLTWTWPTPPEFSDVEIPLDFAAKILAGDENSRLYKILVHEKQLATEVSANMVGDEVSGEFSITLVLRPGTSGAEAKAIIEAEVQKFATEGPTADEIKRIKAQVEYNLITSLEDLEGKADLLNHLNIYLDDPSYYKKIYANYQSVDAKTIKTDFQKWVASANAMQMHFVPTQATSQPDATDRASVPSPSDKTAFTAPKVEKSVLPNGLEIYVSQQPDLPKVLVSLNIKTGNFQEPEDKAGTAFLTAAALERGTENLSFLEIKNRTSLVGASLSSSGTKYDSTVSLSSLKKHLPETFALLADVVLHPTFPNDEIDRIKKERLDEIDYLISRPAKLANMLIDEKLFGKNHPKAIDPQGTKTSLANITRADLIQEYKTFWHPNNAYIAFVGDITLAEAEALAQKHFASWPKTKVQESQMAEVPPHAKTKVYIADFPNTPQTSIRVSFPAPNRLDTDHYAFRLVDSVLGGSMSGRLFKNLREDKGYTYGAYSSYSFGYHTGTMTLHTEAQSDKTYEALMEIKKEILDLKNKRPPAENEIANEKSGMIADYVSMFGSNSGILQRITTTIRYKIGFDIFNQYPGLLQKQTAADIQRSIAEHIPDQGWTIIIVGDVRKIKVPLEKIDWADLQYIDAEGKPLNQ